MAQETFEEVAERLYPIIETNDYMDWYDKNYDIRNSFIAGYKLAQERSYSEEEVLEIITKWEQQCSWKEFPEEWLERFKNK
jgi:hypothetical protein